MIVKYTYKPYSFFLAAFLVTFSFWFGGAYFSYRDSGDGLYMLLMLPGLMAPFLISLVMILKSNNTEIKRDFLNRLINPRLIRIKTLPVLILLMPLSVILSIVLSLLFGESMLQFELAEGFSFSSGFVPVLLLLLFAASFEELGWRGYAFDSLQSRCTVFTASVIFSILWSFWHFPLLFVKDSYQYQIFVENGWYAINFFISIIPMGIILSWICIKNRKSILAAILFHFIINLSMEILNISQTTKCIETVVLFVVAACIVTIDREMFFSTSHFRGNKICSHNQKSSLITLSNIHSGTTMLSSKVGQ